MRHIRRCSLLLSVLSLCCSLALSLFISISVCVFVCLMQWFPKVGADPLWWCRIIVRCGVHLAGLLFILSTCATVGKIHCILILQKGHDWRVLLPRSRDSQSVVQAATRGCHGSFIFLWDFSFTKLKKSKN